MPDTTNISPLMYQLPVKATLPWIAAIYSMQNEPLFFLFERLGDPYDVIASFATAIKSSQSAGHLS